ncbi:hypothetical protein SARC_03102 [Sphaeroforma arctica JP610]|uniref:RSE1/DDB1/CPSF1 first beta-propeller domain-containing protein n=1 Tax=Sphaeroforma arctica JP610 TaxID=667725 RepID=A0A0L0G6Q5_9EUKA|nr:hypothetical protein SARC_03102 [Sphaeroforma arctica JP610]KNC84697.1 hypothetical protein SARC_03102 [Sphaeroforma arctica JP610]|eukprot:XP_014158599.1 hypothetical protein SARC_03102 [Sphaeroforma arctica JP610]
MLPFLVEDSYLTHLVLVGRFPVHGVITGLAKVTLIPGRPDQLIVCTKDAKVSILSFDRCIHRLVNVSLHWFEDEAIKNGMMSNPHETIICVDPSNRCCVLYTFGRCLTILPFNRKEDIGFNDEIANDTSRKDSRVMLHHTQSTHGSNAVTTSHSVGQDLSVWGDDVGALRRMIRPSYTRPITDYDARIRTVHDMAFLHGYFEPTLVVLYESNDTWEGNLGSRSDTISIIALSLNLVDHQQHVIWHVTDLPYDLRRIQLVPEPLGGLILLGTNSMVYLNQSTPAYGVSLNSNMDGCTKFPLVPQPDAVLALNDSVSVFLDESRMFLSTANGSIYSVVLKIDGRNVIGFAIQKAGASVIPACICVITPGLLFLGSRLGDSLCMTYEDTLDKNDEEANVHLLNALKMATASTNENGGKSKEKSDFSTKRLAEGDLDDDLFIYEVDDKGTEHTDDSILSFKVCDILMNVGPITDFCFGEPAYVSDEYVREDRYDLELVTCSGHGKNGALCLMQRGVRPQANGCKY